MTRGSLVITLALLSGCGPTTFDVRRPPGLPELDVVAPKVPQPKSSGSPSFGATLQRTAARDPPDLRSGVLALSVRIASAAPSGPGWAALAVALAPAAQPSLPEGESRFAVDDRIALFDRMLPGLMISHGLTRVVYAASLRRILGRIQRDRGDGRNRDTTTVAGSLEQLAELGGALPADHLLKLEIIEAITGTARVPVTYSYAPEALAAYGRSYESFNRALAVYRSKLADVAQSYRSDYLAARHAYERAGGQYGEPVADSVVRAFERWNGEATQAETAARALNLASPAALAQAAADKEEQREIVAARVHLRATLVDVRSGETFWMADVSAVEADLPAAVQSTLGALLGELLKSSATPAQSSAPVRGKEVVEAFPTESAAPAGPPPASSTRATQEAGARKVRLRIDSDPAGATIVRLSDRKSIGVTPKEIEMDAGGGTTGFSLNLDGYHHGEVSLPTDRDGSVKAKLVPRAAGSATQ